MVGRLECPKALPEATLHEASRGRNLPRDPRDRRDLRDVVPSSLRSASRRSSSCFLEACVNLIIVGLRRSGTTAFWRTFRQDPGFKAYDEPFNPKLITLPSEHRKRIYQEFVDLIAQDAERFWASFAPIPLAGELQTGLHPHQRSYLSFLTAGANRVVFDTTRCHFKIRDLISEMPDSVLVHLYRRPTAFVSSHLLPTRPGLKRRARLAARRTRFWALKDGYDHWGYQTLIGKHPLSAFGLRMTEKGMESDRIYSLPAAGRLLALWKVCYDEAERVGLAEFGERFVSLPFETFADRPEAVLDLIYGLLQTSRPGLDVSHVRPANQGFAPEDSRWQRLAHTAGVGVLTATEIHVGGEPVHLE